MNTFLMCESEHFEIRYEINPWMNIQRGVNAELADQQWHQLLNIMQRCGAKIVRVPPVDALPDLVFTANAALCQGRRVYVSRFRYPERQPEHDIYKRWFMTTGYEVLSEPETFFDAQGHYIGPCFEGAGDALFAGDTLFAAYGLRTDREIYTTIAELFDIKKVVLCELTDPHFYHLDTCFCPLNEHQAIWYPDAFSKETQAHMRQAIELFDIPAEEERHFACNAVVIDQQVIIPEHCPQTRAILEKLGLTVYDCAMSEFIKAGGACKCLTLQL